MNLLIRHVTGLVAIVVVVLAVLGGFIWERHASIDAFTSRDEHFFTPSRKLLENALMELDRVTTQLAKDATDDRRVDASDRLQIHPSMNAIGDRLNHLVRLAREYEYDGAFDLPSRTLRRFNAARDDVLGHSSLHSSGSAGDRSSLKSLSTALHQLEHIYRNDHLDWQHQERKAVWQSTHDAVHTSTGLLLVAGLLIVGMLTGIRSALKHEARIRKELDEARNSLETLALYDELTGLGNRNLFKSHLEQALSAVRRSRYASALLYIDIDDFKRINDSLGHDVGDEVLRIIGSRLKQQVRAGDTVARIGGDEFTIILYETGDGLVVGTVARKLLDSIREPVTAFGHELVLSASIGITMMPGDGNDTAVLMKNADMALYRAKDQGRNNFQFFVEEMNREATRQAMLERELRASIAEERFELHYQTQTDLQSGAITTLEALLRWSTSDGKFIAPDQFIPVAESTGLLVEIGAWTLQQACRDLAALRALGHPHLRVAVNLSARQLHDPELLARIEGALGSAGLEPDALEVEITETTLIEDIDAAVEILQTLRGLGIRVAVDDFGTGYSSLSYLRQLPLDILKIDRSFVRGIEFDGGDRSIVDAILAMGRSLSLKVVAEGIENPWQMDYLTRHGCDRAQGFLLARPVTRDTLDLTPGESEPEAIPPRARGALKLV